MNDPILIDDVIDIYLPLSRLLAFYVEAKQSLFRATQQFLGLADEKTPYVIGIAGSVAAGKSTTARLLKTLLSRWPGTPKVDLITTDGFLYPNEKLTAMGLMDKKGFPESYDTVNLLRVLTRVKAGEGSVEAPMYSHLTYDVLPGRHRVIDHPDILIVEGLNVLLPNKLGTQNSFVSDFFDFSLYVHASENDLQEWYVTRFMRLRETAFRSPDSYFHKYADISDQDAMMIARSIWKKINLANLLENILPTRARADLVLTKDASHKISQVSLRKL